MVRLLKRKRVRRTVSIWRVNGIVIGWLRGGRGKGEEGKEEEDE